MRTLWRPGDTPGSLRGFQGPLKHKGVLTLVMFGVLDVKNFQKITVFKHFTILKMSKLISKECAALTDMSSLCAFFIQGR